MSKTPKEPRQQSPKQKAPPRENRKPRFRVFRFFGRLLFSKVFWILILAALLVLGFLRLFTPYLGPALVPSVSLFSRNQHMSTDGLLEEIRSLDELTILEYLHKAVFPYDFFAPGITIPDISEKLRTDRSGRTLREVLSAEEWQTLEAYNLARLTGFDPGLSGRPFLVVTLVYRYGYNLKEPGIITIRENPGEQTDFTVSLPPPRLLSMEIEDPSRTSYPYPDVTLGVQEWKQISSFISGYSPGLPDEEAVLQSAKESLTQVITGFLPGDLDFRVELTTP
ncbi:DUF4230 domain-containing protein [Spirochaeta lutea]|uniref:DUF4230 domain-containing protein n=1 Tax=Spirochaeta lutea TaxID=1480694 RepID=A0A098QW03_9SPIO|nr:DUF4230 domain-containing protein [Spirochaeta lutea]KGE71839.1 hypothetical protein DC28_08385 [Spirochaeta lutea]